MLFGSIWTIMLPVVLAGIAYLIYRAPGRMRGLHERIPQLSAALVGLLIVAVLGTALNDSGIAIAGVMLGVMTPVLVVVTMRGDRARPRWAISPTADHGSGRPAGARPTRNACSRDRARRPRRRPAHRPPAGDLAAATCSTRRRCNAGTSATARCRPRPGCSS